MKGEKEMSGNIRNTGTGTAAALTLYTRVLIPVPRLHLKGRNNMTFVLWTVQVLLALTFLFAGGLKLVIPPDVLMSMGPPNQIQFPGLFIQFIGVAEVLG